MNRIVLIWSDDTGIIRIAEGNGSNLLPEDENQGYVDYIMIDTIEYNGYDFIEVDGAQVMLTEMFQDKFKTIEDLIQSLVEDGWIPDEKYAFLYTEWDVA